MTDQRWSPESRRERAENAAVRRAIRIAEPPLKADPRGRGNRTERSSTPWYATEETTE